MYIYTVISQGTSLENTPTSHAVSLALFMHACCYSANMLLCHALAYAMVSGGVKKVYTCLNFPILVPYSCIFAHA